MKDLRQFYKDKNVLVTGGAGFIGSHIAQSLCLYGARVTIVDDFSSGSLDNLKDFCKGLTLFASDITSFRDCLKATKKQTIVFHTAAFVSVPESIKQPSLCEKVNVEGTRNLLEACRVNGVKKFVFSSSASVYGERKERCHEVDEPNPQSPYAKSKLVGEKLCKQYSEQHGIKTACLRYFNVYGDRQPLKNSYSGVVAQFKNNLLQQKPIVIYGDGKQVRDFISVTKVARANLFVATSPNLSGEIFNVATGESITMLNLVDKLEKEIGKKRVGIEFKPARSGDIFYSSASCQKYKRFFADKSDSL